MSRTGLALLLSITAGLSAAAAVEQPIAAKKLMLRRSSSGKEKLTFASKDPSFLFPALGSADDPGAIEACVPTYIDNKLAQFASFATPTYFLRDDILRKIEVEGALRRINSAQTAVISTLLSLVLAARFRKPWPIIASILVATLANHTIAAWIGHWVRDVVPPEILRWALALSFFAVAAWALKPDQFDASDAPPASNRSVFAVTAVAFFLAEIGDKTQIATAILAVQFSSLVAVVAGTTLGMLIVDAPTAFIGDAAAKKIPFRAQMTRTCLITRDTVPAASKEVDFKTCTPFSAEMATK